MIDQRARKLCDDGDYVELFRYLNAMWLKVMLEVIDDLYPRMSWPRREYIERDLPKAGVAIGRLKAAIAAVIHKQGRSITLGNYMELYAQELSTIPLSQRTEIVEFWKGPPLPGLLGPGDQPAPTIGNSGDWFLTGFGGTSESVVIGVGFTALQGQIEFTRADGTKSSQGIGAFGGSVGVSLGPSLTKNPVVSKLTQRFPAFGQFLEPDKNPLSNSLLHWLTSSPSLVAKALWNNPGLTTKLQSAIKVVEKLSGGGSIGPASLPSPAIGLVCANNGRVLQSRDFSGNCVLYSTVGTLGVGQAGVWALAFGMPGNWNPASDPALNSAKGFALFSAASISIQIPALAANINLMWGEIT